MTDVARLQTPEVRDRQRAARAHNRTSTPRTTRPGSETTTLVVGEKVRCERNEPGSGTWSRYDGRNGWVASINRQTFPDGTTYAEIGVTWSPRADWARAQADAWFRDDELVRA